MVKTRLRPLNGHLNGQMVKWSKRDAFKSRPPANRGCGTAPGPAFENGNGQMVKARRFKEGDRPTRSGGTAPGPVDTNGRAKRPRKWPKRPQEWSKHPHEWPKYADTLSTGPARMNGQNRDAARPGRRPTRRPNTKMVKCRDRRVCAVSVREEREEGRVVEVVVVVVVGGGGL
jgi:hypothetical protein